MHVCVCMLLQWCQRLFTALLLFTPYQTIKGYADYGGNSFEPKNINRFYCCLFSLQNHTLNLIAVKVTWFSAIDVENWHSNCALEWNVFGIVHLVRQRFSWPCRVSQLLIHTHTPIFMHIVTAHRILCTFYQSNCVSFALIYYIYNVTKSLTHFLFLVLWKLISFVEIPHRIENTTLFVYILKISFENGENSREFSNANEKLFSCKDKHIKCNSMDVLQSLWYKITA